MLFRSSMTARCTYRQIAERGFEAVDDESPLLAMNITEQQSIGIEQLLGLLPNVPIQLNGERFDLSDARYAEIVSQVIANDIGQDLRLRHLPNQHIQQPRAAGFRTIQQGKGLGHRLQNAFHKAGGSLAHSTTSSVVTTMAQRLAAYSIAIQWCALLKSAIASATRKGWISLE